MIINNGLISLLFWPVYVLLFFIPTLIFIPKDKYRTLFIYGFIFGGLIDALTIIIIGNWIGEFTYLAGPYVGGGIPIFVPIAFIFVWMLFFYFLPARTLFLVPYVIGFSGFSITVGSVLQNLGFFQLPHGNLRGALVTGISFLVWFSFSAWFYLKDIKHYKGEM